MFFKLIELNKSVLDELKVISKDFYENYSNNDKNRKQKSPKSKLRASDIKSNLFTKEMREEYPLQKRLQQLNFDMYLN